MTSHWFREWSIGLSVDIVFYRNHFVLQGDRSPLDTRFLATYSRLKKDKQSLSINTPSKITFLGVTICGSALRRHRTSTHQV